MPGLFDDLMKFLNGNPGVTQGPDSGILGSLGLGPQGMVGLQQQLGQSQIGRPVDQMPQFGDALKAPGSPLTMQVGQDPFKLDEAGRAVNNPPMEFNGNQMQMPQGMLGKTPDLSQPPGPPINLAPPQPPPEKQQTPVVQPPRGVMEQFIQQLPELALSGFANIGRNPIPYKGTGQFLGLGALRGLQGAATPFAKTLGENRLEARKAADAAAAAAQYSQSLGHTPQQAAQLAAQANLARHAPVGEMAALENMRLTSDKQKEWKAIVAAAEPELKGSDALLSSLAVAKAKNGDFSGLTDIIAANRIPIDTRMRIHSGQQLTREDIVAIGYLPSEMQGKLLEINNKAADRDAARNYKLGQERNFMQDSPTGPVKIFQEYAGQDPSGRPIWKELGRGPAFKPGASIEDMQQQLVSDNRFWTGMTRRKNILERDRAALDKDVFGGHKPKDAASVLKMQNDRAAQEEDYKRRLDALNREMDAGPPILGIKPQGSTQAPKPPPAEGAPTEKAPPAKGAKEPAATLPTPPKGKMLLRDNKTGATGFYPTGEVPAGFARLR